MMSKSRADERRSNDQPPPNGGFICGVVEGFYGKPWSFDQRKDLFGRLRDLKLNSFMYAPKDDTKHRAKWRQLYSESEANQLRVLIDEAKRNGIDFYYSLAPGLDMVYSDRDELELVLKKYDQLVALGCESFAILFDDIEPAINERDRGAFKNYAAAQVSVTNVVYEHLNRPKFLFCPTEYCESRAVPSVPNSSYLNTVGAGLLAGIDIMWSGSRVISRFITEESIETLTKVIRRPPVIWENLHANDYDRKRVFLGPYSGRSTKIIPKLRGVLTNPNCEYEANYIAIHTLAQWSKCTRDNNALNRCNPDGRIAAIQGDSLRSTDERQIGMYDPDRALANAIRDWLPCVRTKRSLPLGINLSMHPRRIDEAASNQLVKEADLMIDQQQPPSSEPIGGPLADQDSVNVDMLDEEVGCSRSSSEGAASKSDIDMSGSPAAPTNPLEANSCDSCDMQDATCEHQPPPPQPPSSSARAPQAAGLLDGVAPAEPTMAAGSKPEGGGGASLDCVMCPVVKGQQARPKVAAAPAPPCDSNASDLLNFDNLSLLVDLFYLPFEHGLHGCALLRELEWLRDNSDILISENLKSKDQPEEEAAAAAATVKDAQMNVDDSDHQALKHNSNEQQQQQDTAAARTLAFWLERAERLNNLCTRIKRLTNTLIHDCPNKLLTVELYPYLAEMRDVISMITDYVKFLRYRSSNLERFDYSNSLKHGTAKEASQATVPAATTTTSADEQEPWVHRGGLIGDVQRLLS